MECEHKNPFFNSFSFPIFVLFVQDTFQPQVCYVNLEDVYTACFAIFSLGGFKLPKGCSVCRCASIKIKLLYLYRVSIKTGGSRRYSRSPKKHYQLGHRHLLVSLYQSIHGVNSTSCVSDDTSCTSCFYRFPF